MTEVPKAWRPLSTSTLNWVQIACVFAISFS
jgi:hypothetical protein